MAKPSATHTGKAPSTKQATNQVVTVLKQCTNKAELSDCSKERKSVEPSATPNLEMVEKTPSNILRGGQSAPSKLHMVTNVKKTLPETHPTDTPKTTAECVVGSRDKDTPLDNAQTILTVESGKESVEELRKLRQAQQRLRKEEWQKKHGMNSKINSDGCVVPREEGSVGDGFNVDELISEGPVGDGFNVDELISEGMTDV